MNPRYSGEVVGELRSLLYAAQNLDAIADAIYTILKEELWCEFYDEVAHSVIKHETFASFVTSAPPEGLGTTIDRVKNLCRDNVPTLDLLDQAVTRKPGGDKRSGEYQTNHNNIMNDSVQGTSEVYALRRLRKQAPELHKQVIDGELSANAAMVEAGFRKRYIQVPDDAEKAGKILRRHFTREEIESWLA